MNTVTLVKYLQTHHQSSAANLLDGKKLERFNKTCKELTDLMQEIRKDFPEANYLISDAQIHLLLGQYKTVQYRFNTPILLTNSEVVARSYNIPFLAASSD